MTCKKYMLENLTQNREIGLMKQSFGISIFKFPFFIFVAFGYAAGINKDSSNFFVIQI